MVIKIASALYAALPMALEAQDFRGRIGGQILDPAGGAVASAVVPLVHSASSATRNARSDSNGNYTVLYLTPGQYTITIQAAGFKRLVRNGIEIRVGDYLRLDLRMEIGASQEVIRVAVDVEPHETMTASAGEIIDQTVIADLTLTRGNSFTLHRLPKVIYGWYRESSAPFDIAVTSGTTHVGARSGNEIRSVVSSSWLAADVKQFTVEPPNFGADRHIDRNGNVALDASANHLDCLNGTGGQPKEI